MICGVNSLFWLAQKEYLAWRSTHVHGLVSVVGVLFPRVEAGWSCVCAFGRWMRRREQKYWGYSAFDLELLITFTCSPTTVLPSPAHAMLPPHFPSLRFRAEVIWMTLYYWIWTSYTPFISIKSSMKATNLRKTATELSIALLFIFYYGWLRVIFSSWSSCNTLSLSCRLFSFACLGLSAGENLLHSLIYELSKSTPRPLAYYLLYLNGPCRTLGISFLHIYISFMGSYLQGYILVGTILSWGIPCILHII